MTGKMNVDGKVIDNGDCPCNGESCSGAHGWVWGSSDLGHSVHRGKMWAGICPAWKTDERVWDATTGQFVPAEPPAPPGMTPEHFARFRTHNWDNMKMSKGDLDMNAAHEHGKGADVGTHLDHGGA